LRHEPHHMEQHVQIQLLVLPEQVLRAHRHLYHSGQRQVPQSHVSADLPPRRRHHNHVGRMLLWLAAADLLRRGEQHHPHTH
ncbi:hypothetical protein H4R21_007114, partial [Coemansia helicoidea]